MSGYHYREMTGDDATAPMLVLFHGTGGDENQFFDIGRQLIPGARVVAVRGDVSENGALRFFRRTAEGVYDMDDLGVRTQAMARFVAERKAEGQSSAVVGLGYSNGANILASVMFTAPQSFDAAVLMHPLIPFTPNHAAGLAGRRVLLTAGRHDPIAPTARTTALAGYFEEQQAQTQLAWHDGGHNITGDEWAAVGGFLAQYAHPG